MQQILFMDTNYILNIETSTHICSVSLAANGKTIQLLENSQDKTHAELVSVYAEEVLKAEGIKALDLSAVAVSTGPGSYTGLRIGTSVAKGICYGLNIPLIAVPSLYAMVYGAQQALNQDVLYCPFIDARRMEVYTAIYNNQLEVVKETQALIVEQDSFNDLIENHTLVFFGTGAEKCKTIIKHPNALFLDELHISSKNMSALAYQKYLANQFEDTAYYEPYYLKEFQAVKSSKSLLK